MKKLFKQVILLSLLCTLPLLLLANETNDEKDMAKSKKFEQFLKKYALPAEVIQQLAKLTSEEYANIKIGIHEKIPEFVFKDYRVDRIINAIRLAKFLEQEKLTNLDVAQKYIYSPENGKYRVFAKKIESKKRALTLEDVKQLVIMMEKTGFADWNHRLDNIIIATNGKITFIDTEDRSFRFKRSFFRANNDQLIEIPATHLFACSLNKLLRATIKRKCITPEAQQWLTEKLTTIVANNEHANTDIVPIYQNSSFDPDDFDLEIIKKLLLQKRDSDAEEKNDDNNIEIEDDAEFINNLLSNHEQE